MLRDHLRQTVSGHRNHAIGNNAAILCNGYIRSTGSYINQCNIQHTIHFRNGNLNRRNRFQCQIHHIQSRQIYRLIQTVHYIFRQKSGDNIRTDRSRPVAFQITHGVAVHIITHDRIAHTVKFHVRIITVQKLSVSLFHPQRVQCVDILPVHFPVTAQIRIHPDRHRTQHTAGGRNTDILKSPADAQLQVRLHIIYSRSYFIDIMDLSVQHGSCSMFPDTL